MKKWRNNGGGGGVVKFYFYRKVKKVKRTKRESVHIYCCADIWKPFQSEGVDI